MKTLVFVLCMSLGPAAALVWAVIANSVLSSAGVQLNLIAPGTRRVCWWVLSFIALVMLAEPFVLAANRQRQVFVLYSTRRDAQIAVVGERELPRVLDAGLGGNLDYYSEYLDRARIPDPAYQETLR